MQETPYLVFNGAGAFVGSGKAYTRDTPAVVEGEPAPVPEVPFFPPGAVECTNEQYAAAGAWTTLAAGAIVIGAPPAQAE